jgi:hypothetical protein
VGLLGLIGVCVSAEHPIVLWGEEVFVGVMNVQPPAFYRLYGRSPALRVLHY